MYELNQPEFRVKMAERLGMLAMYRRKRGFPKPEAAHEFARRFLVPDWVGVLVKRINPDLWTPERWSQLSWHFGVPVSLMVERLVDWNVLKLAGRSLEEVSNVQSRYDHRGKAWVLADFFAVMGPPITS